MPATKIKLTASEWQLYTCSMACGKAARALNKAANEAMTKDTVGAAYAVWEKVAIEYADFGAIDTEPRVVMYELLAEQFGTDAVSDWLYG